MTKRDKERFQQSFIDDPAGAAPRAGERAAGGAQKETSAKDALEDFRQAVIVVHGMGEQKPLETLRWFADGVAAALSGTLKNNSGTLPVQERVKDALLGRPEPVHSGRYWIVPAELPDAHERSRLRFSPVRSGEQNIRTDMFELYYADLLSGNTLQNLLAWINGLLLRWPHQVPKHRAWPWVIAWLFAVVAVGLLGFGLKENPLKALASLTGAGRGDPNWLMTAGLVLGALFLILLLMRRLRRHTGAHTPTAPRRELPFGLSWIFAVLVPVLLALALLFFVPWCAFGLAASTTCKAVMSPAGLLSTLVGGVMFALVHQFMVPVFGDVPRYLSTAPGNVAARQSVRDRGVALVDALHAAQDEDGSPRYKRIVVVAHSLGSIIALDVLSRYWAEHAPGAQGGLAKRELAAFEAVQKQAEKPAASLDDFARLQRAAAAEVLKAEAAAFRVTDFVTYGSPLALAEFLVARDSARFEALKRDRIVPACPPVLEGGGGFIYQEKSGRKAMSKLHHAAMFSMVRWTAVHDPADKSGFSGDVFAGPCAVNFGSGVCDIAVEIRRKNPLVGRLFTHTSYFSPEVAGVAVQAPAPPGAEFGELTCEKQAHLAIARRLIWPDRPLP